MLITRIILILLGLWLVRKLLNAWRRPPREEAEPVAKAERGNSPFENESIREGEYEEVGEDRGAGGRS